MERPFDVSGSCCLIKDSRLWLCRVKELSLGEIINIYKDGIGVRTQDGEYIITELKEEGKKRLLAKDYLNGKKKEELIGKKCYNKHRM